MIGLVHAVAQPAATVAYSTIGGSLGTSQRGFRAVDNFPGAAANDDTAPSALFPGAVSSSRAIMKAHAEWGSGLWAGTGNGDPVQGAIGSGGANFDTVFLGETPFNGGVNGNVHSYTAASGDFCGAGTLAVTLSPISDGWTIRYCPGFTWDDGPSTPGAGLIDIQGIACHEIGHALGLGHSTATGATMRATVSGSGVGLRSIEADDIAGLQSIYGIAAISKPRITGLSGSTSIGAALVVQGTKFSSNGNEVWFTPAGGSSQPVKVKNLASSNAGSLLAVIVPDGVTSGQVLVKANGSGGASLSNAWPFTVGTGSVGKGVVPKLKKDTTIRASLGFGQLEPDEDVTDVALSGNRRMLAFVSRSSVIAPGDANVADDVFLRDLKKGTTVRISVGPDAVDGDGPSDSPALSRNGRYVAFRSSATNLLDEAQATTQIYRYDRKTGELELVSRNDEGEAANSACSSPSISANGRLVTYATAATNLTDDVDLNGAADIYVTDIKKGTTQLVSRGAGGSTPNGASIMSSLSGNGRVALFVTAATDVEVLGAGDGDVGIPEAFSVFAHTLKTGEIALVSRRTDGSPNEFAALRPSASHNGRVVVYSSDDPLLVENDTNNVTDVFAVDLKKGTTTRVSVAPTPDPKLADFSDLTLGQPAVSANGRYVTFSSPSPDIVPGDPSAHIDVFIYDRKKAVTQMISLTAANLVGANSSSFNSTTSSNGRFIAFLSDATDLVGDDTNDVVDAFVRRW